MYEWKMFHVNIDITVGMGTRKKLVITKESYLIH